MPNIYPYVMDDIGEGIQAKRRGRGVIIDYLIPPMKKAGAYAEYAELTELISGYKEAAEKSPELAAKKIRPGKGPGGKTGTASGPATGSKSGNL